MPTVIQVPANGKPGAFPELIEPEPSLHEPGLADPMDLVAQAIKVHGDLAAVRYGQLAGLAGSQRPAIGGKVGQRHIDLVAHGGDDRQSRAGDRPDDDLLVEGPEILGRSLRPGRR